MPDLGRQETGWAIEAAWARLLYNAGIYSDENDSWVDAFYFGGLSRKIETPAKYIMITCTDVVPASRKIEDRIEICTVEIVYRISKKYDIIDPALIRNFDFGKIRNLVFSDDLKTELQTGLAYRDNVYSATTVEPLQIYNPLYQPENILYIDNSTAHYHGRSLIVQTTVGPS